MSIKRAIAEGIRYRHEVTLEYPLTGFSQTFKLRPLTDIEVKRQQRRALAKLNLDFAKLREKLGLKKDDSTQKIDPSVIGAAMMEDTDLTKILEEDDHASLEAVAWSLSPHPLLKQQGVKEDGVEPWTVDEVSNLPEGWTKELFKIVVMITGGLAKEGAQARKFPDESGNGRFGEAGESP